MQSKKCVQTAKEASISSACDGGPTQDEIFGVPLEVLVAGPYPLYHQLGSEAPLYRIEQSGARNVARYADVAATLRASRFVAQEPMFVALEVAALQQLTERRMVLRDAPAHTRLWRLINNACMPRMVSAPISASTAVMQSDSVMGRSKFDSKKVFDELDTEAGILYFNS
jgi:cytochrome P450